MGWAWNNSNHWFQLRWGKKFSREETFANWKKRASFGIDFRELAEMGDFAGINFQNQVSYQIVQYLKSSKQRVVALQDHVSFPGIYLDMQQNIKKRNTNIWFCILRNFTGINFSEFYILRNFPGGTWCVVMLVQKCAGKDAFLQSRHGVFKGAHSTIISKKGFFAFDTFKLLCNDITIKISKREKMG